MKAFTRLTATAAPLRMINVDTDIIIPKQFLRTIKRTGLGVHAFHDIRYNEDGSPREDFPLNKPAYKGAEILVTGDNFGCGSSREHAPWALADMGLRCVIAPSFADIFFNNSFKNGMLPIVLSKEEVERLMRALEAEPGASLTVDLAAQTISRGNEFTLSFDVDPFRKHCLLNGLDDIGLTEEYRPDIAAYETKLKESRPWLFGTNESALT